MQETETAEKTQEVLPTPTEAAEVAPTPEGAEQPQQTLAEEQETVPPAEKSWTQVEDAYDLLDLEEVKPHIERRIQRERESLTTQYKAEVEQRTKDWESTNLHNTIAGYAGGMADKLDLADLDGAEKTLAKLEKFREPYMEPYKKALRSEASMATGNEFLGLLTKRLDARGQDEFASHVQTAKDWNALLDKYDSFRGQKDYERGRKDGRADQAEQQKLQARKGEGGNITPGSAGGGRDDNKRLLDPTTPYEDLVAIRARQKAAGE